MSQNIAFQEWLSTLKNVSLLPFNFSHLSLSHFLVAKGTLCESVGGFVWYHLTRVHISLSCTRTAQAEMSDWWKITLMNGSFDESIKNIHETASLVSSLKQTHSVSESLKDVTFYFCIFIVLLCIWKWKGNRYMIYTLTLLVCKIILFSDWLLHGNK